MDQDISGIANIVLSSVILGLLLSRNITQPAQGAGRKPQKIKSDPSRRPIAVTDQMAVDREIEERENQGVT